MAKRHEVGEIIFAETLKMLSNPYSTVNQTVIAMSLALSPDGRKRAEKEDGGAKIVAVEWNAIINKAAELAGLDPKNFKDDEEAMKFTRIVTHACLTRCLALLDGAELVDADQTPPNFVCEHGH